MMTNSKNLTGAVVMFVCVWQTNCLGQITASLPFCSPSTLESNRTNQVVLAFTATNNTNGTIDNVGGDIVLSKNTYIDSSDWTLWSGTFLHSTLGPYERFRYGWPAFGDTWPLQIPPVPDGTYYLIFEVWPGFDTAYTRVTVTGGTDPRAPEVVTLPATDLGQTYATLNGRILDDGGAPCQYRFWYRDVNGLTFWFLPWQGSLRSGDSFSATATGLTAGVTYEFWADAKNSAGEADTDGANHLEFIPDLGGVYVEYFAGTVLQGTPRLTGIEANINHNWGYNVVASGLNDGISARWTAYLQIQTAGMYTFYIDSDDGARFWLDDVLFIDNWTTQNQSTDTSGPILLLPGSHPLKMEWYENTGNALARLRWGGPGIFYEILPPAIPRSRLQPRQPSQEPQQPNTRTVVEIDDFEHYTNDYEAGQAIFQTWVGGKHWQLYPGEPVSSNNGSGAIVGHDIWSPGTPYTSIMETEIVSSGNQSMPVYYFNDKPTTTSEVDYTWDVPQDWTAGDLESLSLRVHGHSGNDPAQFYIVVEDSKGHFGRVPHPDPDLVLRDEWVYWEIPLSYFAAMGVNLGAVTKTSIVISTANGDFSATGEIICEQVYLKGPGIGDLGTLWLFVRDAIDLHLIDGARVTMTGGGRTITGTTGPIPGLCRLDPNIKQAYHLTVDAVSAGYKLYTETGVKVDNKDLLEKTILLERPGGSRKEYVFGDTPKDILDFGVEDPGFSTTTWLYLNVTDTGTIADLNVELNIDHQRGSDLDVILFGPDTTDWTKEGGQGVVLALDTNSNLTWTDGSGTIFDDQAPPGRTPHESLTAFNGKGVRGQWTLRITDNGLGAEGKLLSWLLSVELQEQ